MKKAIFILLIVSTLLVGLILPALGAAIWPTSESVSLVNCFRPQRHFSFYISTGGQEYFNLTGTGDWENGSMIFNTRTETTLVIVEGITNVVVSVPALYLVNFVPGADMYFSTSAVYIGSEGRPMFSDGIEFINAELVEANGTRHFWSGTSPIVPDVAALSDSARIHLYFSIDTEQLPSSDIYAIGIWETVVSINKPLNPTSPEEQQGLFTPFDPAVFEQYDLGLSEGAQLTEPEIYDKAFDDGFDDGWEQGYNEGAASQTPTNWTGWIAQAVGGLMDFEIMGGFSIGGLLAVIVSIGLLFAFLRFFAGG